MLFLNGSLFKKFDSSSRQVMKLYSFSYIILLALLKGSKAGPNTIFRTPGTSAEDLPPAALLSSSEAEAFLGLSFVTAAYVLEQLIYSPILVSAILLGFFTVKKKPTKMSNVRALGYMGVCVFCVIYVFLVCTNVGKLLFC